MRRLYAGGQNKVQQRLMQTAKERYAAVPEFMVQQVVVSGICNGVIRYRYFWAGDAFAAQGAFVGRLMIRLVLPGQAKGSFSYHILLPEDCGYP